MNVIFNIMQVEIGYVTFVSHLLNMSNRLCQVNPLY